jgi:PPP family 3-phenylpropionic acid transporter
MESMKATKTLIGLALTVSTISELPIMFFSNLLLRRLKARGLLILAMAIVGIRCLLYYFVNTSGGVLAIQLLHGLTFPILWVAGVTHAAESAPAGLGATAQGVFSGTLLGFGAAAGSLLGGILIDRLGPAGMFGVIGWVVLSSLVVLLFFERKFIRVVA